MPTVTPIPTVGLNPIGFGDPRIWPRPDASVYERYLENLAALASWLLSQNYNVEAFTSETSVDRHALEDLEARLRLAWPPDRLAKVFQPPALTLDDLLLQMSRFDFVITSKFHGVVFSHLLTKPVIALSYHTKIQTLMNAVGHGQYCFPIEGFDADAVIEAFKSLTHDSDGLRSKFREAVLTYGDALQIQFDELFCPTRDRTHWSDP